MKWLLLMLFAFVSSTSYATCSGNGISYAAPINVDLSDKLSTATPEWTGTFTTQYAGTFNCTTYNSDFAYTPILSNNIKYATILGFNNNKHMILAEITSTHSTVTLKSNGLHSASELNTRFNVRFSLVNQGGMAITGETVKLYDVLFVSDLSGLSFSEIILWPLNQVQKIFTWLFNGFRWPYDTRDMFGQPMIIKYSPKQTTCSFINAGLTVSLPTLGVNQINSSNQPGLTPFILNMRCQDISIAGTSDRAIEMFLSSNTLHSSDNSVLVDNSASGIKGIGLRLTLQSKPQTPVMISTSNTSRGMATLLYNVSAGHSISDNFSIPMTVYYYAWDKENITQGKINTSATLNIIYP